MYEIEEIVQIRKMLIGLVKEVLQNDISNIDTEELGLIIDMIKDLFEVEKNCYILKENENRMEDKEMNSFRSIMRQNEKM